MEKIQKRNQDEHKEKGINRRKRHKYMMNFFSARA
jgi:hypothetical protein